jgi:hypothetical protein
LSGNVQPKAQGFERELRGAWFKDKGFKYYKPGRLQSLCAINEHFEPVFNTVLVTQIEFQQSAETFRTAAINKWGG